MCNARDELGVTSRDLTVLNALLSFHPSNELDTDKNLVVFPSNRTLSARTCGMAESTLRRHLSALVRSGLIERRNSPNGKRYARRSGDGDLRHVFGFDLRPLLTNATEILEASQQAEDRAERIQGLRDDIAAIRADIIAWVKEFHVNPRSLDHVSETIETTRRILRRKLSENELQSIKSTLAQTHKTLTNTKLKTNETNANDSKNERHYHNSKNEHLDRKENTPSHFDTAQLRKNEQTRKIDELELTDVTTACSQINDFSTEPINDWRNLVSTANSVRRMMGIRDHTWDHASSEMGPKNAAITIAGILQRFGEIKSPSAYLNALTRKAATGKYTPEPMIRSLLGQVGC